RLHFGKGALAVTREFVKRPDIRARLHIVGEGPDRNNIEILSDRDKRIAVEGNLEPIDVRRLLAGTAIFVFPSLHEGLSLALLEAMASGHACLLYDMPHNREVLGDAGIYAPYNQPATMVEIIGEVVQQKAVLKEKAKQAHDRAKMFSWTRCAHEMEKALRSVY